MYSRKVCDMRRGNPKARGDLYLANFIEDAYSRGEISVSRALHVAGVNGYESDTLQPHKSTARALKNVYEMFRDGIKNYGWPFYRVSGRGINSVYALSRVIVKHVDGSVSAFERKM